MLFLMSLSLSLSFSLRATALCCAHASLRSLFVLTALATASAASDKAEYRLQAGDVIEIRVAGMPELQQRVTVQGDGEISLPLLGTLTVAGSTTSNARAKIQAALATKIFRLTTADGRERPVAIKFDEVSASVVEYRPLYIQGDVMKPGELAYRPHMTVRQAIGGAGGYYQLRLLTMSAVRDVTDLQGEYATLWTSLAKERLNIWRLTTELDASKDSIADDAEPDPGLLKDVPLPKTMLTNLSSGEAAHLKVRKVHFQREKSYLIQSIAQAGEHIAALEEQQKKEEEGTEADLAELQRVTELFKSGNLVMPRITEARRAVLLSTTRQVQTRTELINAIREKSQLSRQLEKLPDELNIGLLKELQEARARLSTVQSKLQAIGEILPYAAKPAEASEQAKVPKITIFRNDLNGERVLDANGDTELRPGDVVEVKLIQSETNQAAVR